MQIGILAQTEMTITDLEATRQRQLGKSYFYSVVLALDYNMRGQPASSDACAEGEFPIRSAVNDLPVPWPTRF